MLVLCSKLVKNDYGKKREHMGNNILKDKFIGGDEARIDESGRFILPVQFKKILLRYYGNKLYITSADGEKIDIYPMKVWEEVARDIFKLKVFDPDRTNFIRRMHSYGQLIKLDARGRILLPPALRESAGIKDRVAIISQFTYLEVWDYESYSKKMATTKIGEEQLRILADKLTHLGK
ncbi:MAG: hypothetical protein A2Y62_17175 [Candidatus Fischerbacteria bacterium RBG_13_37_8]|uniref:Transcriptional regulator MraZ n=1 Tax=Candidatus Fischerbacteria bacterium RBG_13_37_8 TaxID=1817863 RepID=A0A1F5VGB7_9BACT|nr:MAG: hypothetical protein A2Y62_17175 [Candidatus Fischerbacteria bacterium RBG_13_37_8]